MISISSFFSGIAGASITLGITYYWRTQDAQKRKAVLRESMKTELETIRSIYLPVSEKLDGYWNAADETPPSITQDYTIIYDTNAGKIGALQKEEAAAVILAYTKTKQWLDALNTYFSACRKYIEAARRDTAYTNYEGTARTLCNILTSSHE